MNKLIQQLEREINFYNKSIQERLYFINGKKSDQYFFESVINLKRERDFKIKMMELIKEFGNGVLIRESIVDLQLLERRIK